MADEARRDIPSARTFGGLKATLRLALEMMVFWSHFVHIPKGWSPFIVQNQIHRSREGTEQPRNAPFANHPQVWEIVSRQLLY